MPNQNQKTVSLVHYLRDVSDAYSLAESDMHWMSFALEKVRREVMRLNKLAENGTRLYDHDFLDLMTQLDMYSYLADERHNRQAELATNYTNKYNSAKGGEHDTTP